MSWESIKTAPRDGSNILLWEVCEGIYIGYWDVHEHHYAGGRWEPQDLPFYGCMCSAKEWPMPKYWMPLPDDKICKDMWFSKDKK